MFRKLLPAIALFSFAGVAHAGDKPIYAPPPAWVKPAPPIDASKLTDADPILIMIDQQQRLQDGEVWSFMDTATRVASPQLLTQIGTLPIPWDPGKGDLTIHKVELIRGAEHIDLLAGGARFNVIQREQQLERASLNGMLTATMAMEGIRVGDVVHVSFSISRKDSALRGHVQTLAPLVPEPNRIQFGRLRLLWPKSMPVQWRAYLKTDAQPVDTPDGFRELTIKLPAVKPAEIPGDAPLRYQPLPLLEAADYASWEDMSKDMAVLFNTEGTIAPGSPIAAEVARIAAASQDQRTRAAMALQLVQDKVRYLFRGMDDGDYVPQPPEKTWSVRYGDCKAKSLLLLAMLRALGIEADAALVNAQAGDLVGSRIPAPLSFNHVIVRATIGGETLWLDGTDGGVRSTDLTDVPPFRYALPLRSAGSGLVEMPMRLAGRPGTEVNLDIDATAGVLFPMPYKIRVVTRGSTAEMLRLMSMQSGKEQLDGMIDGMVLGSYLGRHETATRAVTYDEANGAAVITSEGLIYSDWAKDGERYKVQLDTSVDGISFAPDRARATWRDIPVATGSPDDRLVRVRIHLPNNGAGFALEGDKTLPATLGGVGLKRSTTMADGWITVEDRVATGLNEIAPADIPATRAALAQAKTRLLKAVSPADYPPRYVQIVAARRAKTFDPVLSAMAARIAEKPDDAERYTSRASFLASIYDWQGQLRDLDKAIALAPDSATYLWRSGVRSALHDDAGAMADAKAALDLDPASAAAAGRLASLQSETGKRDAALALLAERAATAGEDRSDYVSAEATLRAEAGKVEEGLGLLDGLIAEKPGNPALLNSRCWLKGTYNVALDTALKDCTKSIELADDPSAALDSRAMVYFRMNRFDDALADLDAALAKNPELPASLFMRGVIRKRTGANTADADLGAARMMAPRIDEQYKRWGIAP